MDKLNYHLQIHCLYMCDQVFWFIKRFNLELVPQLEIV
jgi:hypothetical protein